MARSVSAVVIAVLAGGVLGGCFYDSRWGESKRMQEAAARHATPRTLQATEGGGPDNEAGPVREMRIHAHATPRYAAEAIGWQKQLGALVEDANRLLEGTLRIRLEVAETEVWASKSDDQSLSDSLDELRALDDGADADWVIGLVGSVPRAETSFHQIGLSYRPGKHVVLRAMADALEMDAILKNLKEISQDEKDKLYAARKRHKVTTVLLHEIAHSLGVIHERGSASIMSPVYSIEAERFSPEATEWMRAALRARASTEPSARAALEDTTLGILQRSPEMWIATERDELTNTLTAAISRRAPPSKAAAPVPPASAKASAAPAVSASAAASSGSAAANGLSAGDQSALSAAETHEKAGRYADAEKTAKALFSKYPDSLPVQDMRCRLAMQLHADSWDLVTSECAPFTRLSGTPGKK